jgi:hypothetical protein
VLLYAALQRHTSRTMHCCEQAFKDHATALEISVIGGGQRCHMACIVLQSVIWRRNFALGHAYVAALLVSMCCGTLRVRYPFQHLELMAL